MSAFILLLVMVGASGHELRVTSRGDGIKVPPTEVLNPQSDLTLEAWIKPKPNDESGPFHFIISKQYEGTGYALLLIGKGNDYRIEFEANERIKYFIPMNTLQDRWWHVAGVFHSGKSIELYINGIRVTEQSTTKTYQPNPLPLYLGTSPWDTFSGSIDDIRIWSEARSSEQIVRDMDSKLSGKERGLIALWDFERIAGRTVFDRTHHTKPGKILGKSRIVRMKKSR